MARPALRFTLALTVPLAAHLAGGPCGVSRAAAHAPPEVLQVVSSAPGDVILATNRGLIFGSRERGAWQLLCNEAFGVSTGSGYRTVMLPGGRILVAEQGGLRISDDRGCTWRHAAALGKLSTPALAQHPEARSRLYLTVYGFDGTSVVEGAAGVRRSDDGGETFRTVYPATDGAFLNSLLVSGGEPGHVYASATTFGPSGPEYLVLHSADGGASWQRSRVDADATTETDVTLLALNPQNPLELLARASVADSARGERLLWSTDGGGTFTALGAWPLLRSAAFSPDGTSAFVSHRDGLLRATPPARAFARLGVSVGISSVVTTATDLLASGYFAGPASALNGVGSAPWSDPSAGFQTLMTFDQVTAHVSCPAPSTAEQDCDLSWRDWATEQGLATPGVGQTDAGAARPMGGAGQGHDGADASAAGHGGTSADAPRAKKSGCSLSAQSPDEPMWWLPLSLLAIFLVRRRPMGASRSRNRACETMPARRTPARPTPGVPWSPPRTLP